MTLSTGVIDEIVSLLHADGVDHKFFGWSDGSTVYQGGDSYILGETNPTFTAQWARVFGVRYALAGGAFSGSDTQTDSECVGGDSTCSDGQTITLNAVPTGAGYLFDGWLDQSASLKTAATTTVISATSYLFYAKWTAIEYNMGFNSLGGSNAISNQTKTIGQLLIMPNPGTKTGYTFGGWSDSVLTYGVGTTFTVASSSKSFSAVWDANVYNVTYDWQGGSSSTPGVSDDFTVGTGNMLLPTALSAGYNRDGYTFSGWATSIGGSVLSTFQPTADDVLYAIWADGNYTLSYHSKGGEIGSGIGSVAIGESITLPTPIRPNFSFLGWYDAATGGSKIGDGRETYTPLGSRTLYARWVQNSLFGVDEATLEAASTFTASDSTGVDTTITHTPSGTSATVQIPAGSLTAGTVITVRYFKDTERQSNLIEGDNNYFFSLLVSWILGSGDSATVPNTAAGKPITVTLTNSSIKAGAMIYQVIGTAVTELGRATVDGSVQVELTEDPEIVVAATKPGAPTSVSAVKGDSQATVIGDPHKLSGRLPSPDGNSDQTSRPPSR